ncbi:hypothetical protein K438DRAFT_1956019 [Mycena galopus ATCC 62051]|nr:hypothetical protein K438DRAFT_1956019 [Mycena galopus ATCC 62051]
MLSIFRLAVLAIALLFASKPILGRELWLERDGQAIYPRRFGQDHPAVLTKLRAACGGGVCQTSRRRDTAKSQFNGTTQATMIALAVEYRQTERHTLPDFAKNPPIQRNSVFRQTAPKNAELNGLVQAQDPANDPNVFFQPRGRVCSLELRQIRVLSRHRFSD